MNDRWLSADEIASYLGVTKDTVYTWVTSKGMPGHKGWSFLEVQARGGRRLGARRRRGLVFRRAW